MASKWGTGKTIPQIVKQIEGHAPAILEGRLLAIDPASRSLGFCLYQSGQLLEKGKIVSKAGDVNTRLRSISAQLIEKFKDIDILAVEKIRGSQAHDYLRWSIGAVVVSVNASKMVEVPISFWKKIMPEGYVKDDDNDAELIGTVMLHIAQDSRGIPLQKVETSNGKRQAKRWEDR